MIRVILTTFLLICFTSQVSQASYLWVEAYRQHDTTGANGKRSTLVLVMLREHITMDDGTGLDPRRGESLVCVDGYPEPVHSPDCPPVPLGNAIYFTSQDSPECAREWLSRPGVDSLVAAAVNLALRQKRMLQDRLRITSGPGYIGVEVNSQIRDLDGASFDIYDSSGKQMEAHKRLQGDVDGIWFTIAVPGFAPGTYKAIVKRENGRKMETHFELR